MQFGSVPAVALVGVLVACGHGSEPRSTAPAEPPRAVAPPADPPAAAAPASDCPARAAAVGTFLTAMDHDAPWFDVDGVALPLRTDLGATDDPRGASIRIAPGTIEFMGQSGLGRRELTDRLAAMGERSPLVYLIVDGATPWSEIVPVLDAVRAATLDQVRFVVGRPATTPPPPRTPTDDDFDAAVLQTKAAGAGTERGRAFSAIVERIATPCPALIAAFGAAGSAPDFVAALIAGVEPALVECDCAADPAAVQTAIWRVVGNPSPVATLPVTLAAKGTRFAHPPATPWRDVVPALVAGATIKPAVAK